MTERAKRLGVRMFEEGAFLLQTFSLPRVGARQDKAVRQIYKSANVLRKRAGMPQKQYLMLNQKGLLEEVT